MAWFDGQTSSGVKKAASAGREATPADSVTVPTEASRRAEELAGAGSAGSRGWRNALLLAGVVALHVAGSLYWLWRNTIFIGHDASKYLQTSLEIQEFFGLSAPAFLRALTFDAYRPPALFVAIQPFFALFGVSPDSAQFLNILLGAAAILIVFMIGQRIASAEVGLLSALLLALLPMTAGMARLLYTEMLLMVLVALNLLALYAARGFVHRGWVLVWGASLGLGLLTKWTMPIYVGLPLLWFLWRAGALTRWRQVLRRFHFNGRAALLALSLAALLTALWVWPSRELLLSFAPGYWMIPAWWLALTLLLYALLSPATRASNWWAGTLLAVVIASLWYLPYFDFAARLLLVDQERGATAAHPLNPQNYWRYFQYLYGELTGPLVFWVIIPLALAPWLVSWIRRRPLNPSTPPLWLSLLSSLAVLFVIAQANARNLAPLLPAATLLAVVGLHFYPRSVRRGIGIAWVTVLALQWSLFTFDGLDGVLRQTQGLWVDSSYVLPPASDLTDPGYGIGHDVLERVTAGTQDRQYLAMLVNIPAIHRGALRNQILLEGRNVRIKDVTEDVAQPWRDILTADWLLVKDGDNRDVEGVGLEVVQRILAGDPLFHSLYAEVQRYPLPNGETALLYRRATPPYGYPLMMNELSAKTAEVAATLRDNWSAAASTTFANRDLAFWVGLHGIPTDNLRVLDEAAAPAASFAGQWGTIFVVSPATDKRWLPWLEANTYHAVATGNDFAGLDIYGRPTAPLQAVGVQAAWPTAELLSLRTLPSLAPGEVLPLELSWRNDDDALKVSYRLLDGDGNNVASLDRPLLVSDRLGLFAPPATPPGAYQVAAIVYDAATLAPIADVAGNVPTVLATVTITPAP